MDKKPTVGVFRPALDRLIAHALRSNGQSRCVANFLLSWWDAKSCGGFNLTDCWGCDDLIIDVMVVVFLMATRINCYPDALGYKKQFQAISNKWQPSEKI